MVGGVPKENDAMASTTTTIESGLVRDFPLMSKLQRHCTHNCGENCRDWLSGLSRFFRELLSGNYAIQPMLRDRQPSDGDREAAISGD
jgi:hypothetical protein